MTKWTEIILVDSDDNVLARGDQDAALEELFISGCVLDVWIRGEDPDEQWEIDWTGYKPLAQQKQ